MGGREKVCEREREGGGEGEREKETFNTKA